MPERSPHGERFDWGEMVHEVAEVEEILAQLPQPGARLIAAGTWLMTAFACCLAVGNAVVRLWFPELLGTGLNARSLAVLVPVWALGGVGLLLFLVGQAIRWRAKKASSRKR